MDYRKLRPVRHFLQWVKSLDDAQMLNKAAIGGFFTYPPPPVSLETYMKDRRGELPACFLSSGRLSSLTQVRAGEPGFLRGLELQREMERLCYRERRTFCVQATVTVVTYSRRGQVRIFQVTFAAF